MQPADSSLQDYYAARAREYERIYARPDRQADLRKLEKLIPDALRARSVLEIACGTGYWTQHLARTAKGVVATDLTEETLAVAHSKNLPAEKVRYRIENAFSPPAGTERFYGAFAGFWWSHMKLAECGPFLAALRPRLATGAVVAFLDNLYVEGSSTPIAERDADGNSWQLRKLEDGTEHRVLKNFPTEAGLMKQIEGFGTNCRYLALDYYWLFSCEVR